MASSSLNVIALISGGKDSLFSILHCIANGHKIVALANLYPEREEENDIESYMYQTVGHRAIPLYEKALGLPLYREPIRGGAVNARREYAPSGSRNQGTKSEGGEENEDETESLIPLLRRVMEAHPEANAVSAGAILSTYQRTRVESVALRLGLVPLSYLWQFPYLPPHRQTSLLEDMHTVGQQSIIVKVASGGLTEEFLGLDVADPKAMKRIASSMAKFGSHEVGNVLGEGGEFETLAVKGPGPFWKGNIVLEGTEVVISGGGSALLKISRGEFVAQESLIDRQLNPMPRKPDLLDAEFQDIIEELGSRERIVLDCYTSGSSTTTTSSATPLLSLKTVIKEFSGEVVRISNLHCSQHGLTAAEQMRHIVGTLRLLMDSRWSRNPSSIVFASILLRSMADFATVNAVYGSVFEGPNPPARATIACGRLLPKDVDVMLSVTFELGLAKERNALHVQSRSYWAPANIGPYSQAIAIPARPSNLQTTSAAQIVYIAGQIPLIPSSMELATADKYPDFRIKSGKTSVNTFKLQAVLALQHLWRIGRSMSVQWWSGGIAFISNCDSGEAEERAAIAAIAWDAANAESSNEGKQAAEETEAFDVWHTKNDMTSARTISYGDTRPPLPDYSASKTGSSLPPCYIVQVQELPRGASIEWLSTGVSSSAADSLEQQCVFQTTLSLHCTRILPDGPVLSYIGLPQASCMNRCVEHSLTWIPSASNSADAIVHFFTVYVAAAHASDVPWLWIEEQRAEVVPCWRIWQGDGIEIEALIVVDSRQKRGTQEGTSGHADG